MNHMSCSLQDDQHVCHSCARSLRKHDLAPLPPPKKVVKSEARYQSSWNASDVTPRSLRFRGRLLAERTGKEHTQSSWTVPVICRNTLAELELVFVGRVGSL
jgi:hypothetical protein